MERWQSTASAAERSAAEAKAQASLSQLIPAGKSRTEEAWEGLTSAEEVEAARKQIEQANASISDFVGEQLWQAVKQKQNEIVFDAVQEMVEEALLATADIPTQEVAAALALEVSHRAARRAVSMTAVELLQSSLALSSEEWGDILAVSAMQAAEAAATQFLSKIALAGGLTLVTGDPLVITSIVSLTMVHFSTVLLKHVVAEVLLEITEAETSWWEDGLAGPPHWAVHDRYVASLPNGAWAIPTELTRQGPFNL